MNYIRTSSSGTLNAATEILVSDTTAIANIKINSFIKAGTLAKTSDNSKFYWDPTSSATASSSVIVPLDASPGRWLLDNVAGGSSALFARVATVSSITLSGTQTIDGIAVIVNDKVLVKNQVTASQNGIYVVGSSTWTRAVEFNSSINVVPNAVIAISEGTINKNSTWYLANSGSITVGTTSLNFAPRDTLASTIANLRSIIPNDTNAHINVISYSISGDGGGGNFYWNPTSTEIDNNGTIITPTGSAIGRWKRQYAGAIDPRWFGAKGDIKSCSDGTVSGTSITGTLNFTQADVGKILIFVAAKNNPMTGTFTTTSGVAEIDGSGSNCSGELHLGQTVVINSVSYQVVLDPITGANTITSKFYASPAPSATAGPFTAFLPAKPLITTIATVTDATHCTVSAGADITISSGGTILVGTDDTTALIASFLFPSVRISSGKYFTSPGLIAGLVGQEIYGQGRDSSILVSTSATTGGVILAQANKLYIHDLGFWGQAVDDKTSQFAIISDGTWATVNGSGAAFSTINNTDSFTLSIDPLITTEATGVIAISFTNSDTTIQAVLNRINLAFHNLSADVAVRTNSSGTQLRLVSPNAGITSQLIVAGNGATLTKLGILAGTYTGSGTAAKDCKVTNIRLGGAVPGIALHCGVKAAHGCHRWTFEHIYADQLCGSNGILGCGYGILIAGNRGAYWDDISVQGSSFGGRHVVYNSGGAVDVKGGICQGSDMLSSTYHLFSDWTEGPTRNINVKQILAIRQKQGESGTGCAEFTGIFENIYIEDITAYDCAQTTFMASSYAYPAGLAKNLTINNFLGVRNNQHGCIVRGAQNVRAKGKLIDPGYGTPSTYAGATVVSNPDSGSNVISDNIFLDIEVISTTPGAPLHTQVVRLEPSGNGPTNVDVVAIGDPGVGGLFAYQILPRKASIRHRTPPTYTPGATTPSVLGVSELVLTQSGATTLTNFTNGYEGQIVQLRITDDLTIINDGGNFSLAYGTTFRSTANTRITFQLKGSIWEEIARVGGETNINSPTTPPRQQLRVTANNLGSLGNFVFGADNCAIPFDVFWRGSQWVATNSSSAWLYKQGGEIRIGGAHGQAVGDAINETKYLVVDIVNETINVGGSAVGPVTLRTGGVVRLTIGATGVITIANLGTGLVHADSSGNLTSSTLLNADVNAAAAIAGTKISPNFGAQNIVTTGALSIGTNPASVGDIRLANGFVATFRNNTNSADITAVSSSGNTLTFGSPAQSHFTCLTSEMDIYSSSGVIGLTVLDNGIYPSGNYRWINTITSPKLIQNDNTTNSATGQTLTVQAQNATGTTSVGGRLDLVSGTGTSSDGNININTGSTNRIQITSTAVIQSSPLHQFATAISSPTLNQADNSTNSATGQPLTIQSQNATGLTANGGALNLTSGTGTTLAGNVNIKTGGTTRVIVSPSGLQATNITLPVNADTSSDILDTTTLSTTKILTTDATLTKVISTTNLTHAIPNSSVVLVSFTISGYRTGGAAAGSVGDSASFVRTCMIKNIAGSLSISNTVDSYSFKDDAAWGDPVVALDGSTDIKISIVGLINANISWAAECGIFINKP